MEFGLLQQNHNNNFLRTVRLMSRMVRLMGLTGLSQVESVFFRQVFTCIRTNNDNRMKINKEYSTSIYGTGKHITQDRSDRTIRR